ncbi:hypothetical protein J3458_003407 [Metarhizium acridum]|uniref:uncharacterized protein n=1 Tax=Metarhizium acridum TaxID=92637 RepID=UPI001C6C89B1|nr:hypothetical protein J3458_003407 [Metarhizium acridum]
MGIWHRNSAPQNHLRTVYFINLVCFNTLVSPRVRRRGWTSNFDHHDPAVQFGTGFASDLKLRSTASRHFQLSAQCMTDRYYQTLSTADSSDHGISNLAWW